LAPLETPKLSLWKRSCFPMLMERSLTMMSINQKCGRGTIKKWGRILVYALAKAPDHEGVRGIGLRCGWAN
jgi:hypothetical protein